jgi:two-component system OmpR family sensor kinase
MAPSRWTAPAVRRLETMPLRVRLVAILLVLLTAALILLSLTTAYLTKRDLIGRIDAELVAVAAPVANQAIDDLNDSGTTGTPTGYAFVLMTPSGAPVHYRNPTGEKLHPSLPRITLTDSRVRFGEPFTVESSDGKLDWRFVAGRVGTEGTFAVGIPLRSMNQTMRQLLVTSSLISAGVLALCALIGWYAVSRAFRPLRQIEDTAAAIAKGDLTRRIDVRSADDEVTSLSRSLNVMLSRIETSFAVREASEARMREFVADASHELRTPLATVRGYAELHRQGALAAPAALDGAMGRIESESRRMAGLVEDLLVLARLDDEPVPVDADVDLTVLAGDAVADARVRAPERTVRLIGRDGPLGPLRVHGSDARLRQVLTNVLANALAHTPAGTPVEVRLGRDFDDIVLEVVDHGPGIPAEQRPHVFERFYRADPSRSRDAGGGSGLGLAIVAAIVTAHRGRVGIAETPGGGATFVVRLPAADRVAGHPSDGAEG